MNDGSIKFLDFYKSLETDWKIKEIITLAKCQYVPGNAQHLVFRLPEGLGSFADDVAITASIVAILDFCLQHGPTAYEVLSKKFKNVINAWSERNISSLKEIREFLSTKQSWKTGEVMVRLHVDEELAKAIMIKLGFTFKKNKWIFIENSSSLQTRSKWLKKEEDMEKAQEDFLHNNNYIPKP